MRRAAAIAFATLAALTAPAAGADLPAPVAKVGGPAGPAPSRLLVTAREYSLTLSRPKVAPGPAVVQLYNFGEDPHDLSLRRAGTDRIHEIGEVEPGRTGSLTLRLRKRSRYRLWCAIPTHAGLGMVAKLRTKARVPRD